MTALHPALDAALANDRVIIFGALEMQFDSGTVRLLDGSAEIEINGETFVGEEPDFGVWEAIDDFEDGTGDEAPGLTVTILPASDEAALAMSSPDVQGAPVIAMIGAVTESTGLVIGEPYQLIIGEIDVPVHKIGLRSSSVEFNCVGGMERLFFADEGIRLAPSFHEQVWPDETGFSHVTGVADFDYWGMQQ